MFSGLIWRAINYILIVDVMLFVFSLTHCVISVGSLCSSSPRDPVEINSGTNVYVLWPEVLPCQARTDEIPVDKVSNHNTFILYQYLFCFTLLSVHAAELSHLYLTVRASRNKMLLAAWELRIVLLRTEGRSYLTGNISWPLWKATSKDHKSK